MTALSPVLTPPQVAEHLQVTLRTVLNWLKDGKIPGAKIGGTWRVSAAALEKLLAGKVPRPYPRPNRRRPAGRSIPRAIHGRARRRVDGAGGASGR